MAEHDWGPSNLGHGEAMCRRCFITNREAMALGKMKECDVAPHVPSKGPTNDNNPTPDKDTGK